MDSKNLVWQS